MNDRKPDELPALGYCLEFKPGDPCYYSPEDYETARRTQNDGADVWGLFAEPQSGCSSEVEVYHGWCWVRPRYATECIDMTGFIALYRGPLLRQATPHEAVARLFGRSHG